MGFELFILCFYIIPCCNFGYDFCIRRCWVSRYPQLFVICIMSYLRYLYLFTYILDYVSTKKGDFPEANMFTLCEHLGSFPFCLFSLLSFYVFVAVFFFFFIGGAVLFTLFALCCVFYLVFFRVLRLVSSFACVNTSLLHRFSLSFIHNALLFKDKNKY
jgi:hypothetical protein